MLAHRWRDMPDALAFAGNPMRPNGVDVIKRRKGRESQMRKLVWAALLGLVCVGCGETAHSSHSTGAPAPVGRSTPPTPSTSHSPHSTRAPASLPHVVSVDFLTAREGWIVVDDGAPNPGTRLYHTTNGGQHWAVVADWTARSPAPWAAQSPAAMENPMAIDFQSSSTGWAVINTGVGACQAGFALYRTTDGGEHWQHVQSLQGSDGPVSILTAVGHIGWFADASCAAPGIGLWSVGQTGLHWRPGHPVTGPKIAAGGGPTAVQLARTAQGPLLSAAYIHYGPHGHTARTYWQVTRLPGPSGSARPLPFLGRVQAIAFLSPQIGWVAGRSQVWATDDGGAQWHRLPMDLTGWINRLDLVTPTTGWVSNGTQLARTTDGGRHFTPQPIP